MIAVGGRALAPIATPEETRSLRRRPDWDLCIRRSGAGMENVIVIGILAAMALACELWLRKKEAENRRPAEDIPTASFRDPLPAAHRLPIGEVPFDAIRGRLSATPHPPSVNAN